MRILSKSAATWPAVMIVLGVLIAVGPTWAQVELFKDADASVASSIPQSRVMATQSADGVKRSRIALLKTTLDLEQPSLVLNLFSDKILTIKRDALQEYESMKGWVGKIDGDSFSSVTIYFKDKWASGRISQNGMIYTFDTNENGATMIVEIDEGKLKQETDMSQIRQ